jgi:hypothetical protein
MSVKIAVFKEHSFGYIDEINSKSFQIISSNYKAPTNFGGTSYHINNDSDVRLANIEDFETFRIFYPQYTEKEYLWNKPQPQLTGKD